MKGSVPYGIGTVELIA